jgi:hypothetical protein
MHRGRAEGANQLTPNVPPKRGSYEYLPEYSPVGAER